jgi:hypothetical protein
VKRPSGPPSDTTGDPVKWLASFTSTISMPRRADTAVGPHHNRCHASLHLTGHKVRSRWIGLLRLGGSTTWICKAGLVPRVSRTQGMGSGFRSLAFAVFPAHTVFRVRQGVVSKAHSGHRATPTPAQFCAGSYQ